MADKDNTTLLLWGGIAYSPLGWLYLGVRFLISFLVVTLLVIWDLISTIFLIIWKIITDLYPFLLIVIAIFIVLLIIHLEWAHFVDFMNKVFLPLLQIILDDFIRFIWNDVWLPIANILVQIWDSLVQVIGFFIYFAYNMFITVINLIIELVGVLDLPALFEDIMEIVTGVVQLFVEIFKLFVTVGLALIQKLIPVIIAVLKIWFEYIKFLFEIFSFLLITVFRILPGIIDVLTDVVNIVLSWADWAMVGAARVLLSTPGGGFRLGPRHAPNGFDNLNKKNRKSASMNGMDAGEFLLNSMYVAATREYGLQHYEKMYEMVSVIHKGILSEDVYHSQEGYFLEPGGSIPDYTRHLYHDDDLHDHERGRTHEGILPENRRMAEDDLELMYEDEESLELDQESGVQPAGAEPGSAPMPSKRDLKDWKGIDTSELPPEQVEELERTKAEFLESLREPVQYATKEQIEQQEAEAEREASISEFVERFTNPRVKKPKHKTAENKGPHVKKPNPMRSRDPYKNVHPDDHWRIDYTHNMTSKQVFGKKVKRPQLHKLHPTKSPKQMHEQRKRAVAYAHAVQKAYERVYKKHIGNKHIHKVFASSFKHLTGHDSVHDWAVKFQQTYVSPAHMMYSVVPSTHDRGFFKYLWRADPDYEKRLPFHAWVEREFQTKNLSREYWERVEELSRAKENGEAHDENSGESITGPLTAEQSKRTASRELLSKFFAGLKINLEILYEDDCFTTPRRNILCLPFIPTWWTIPFINLSSVVLTRDLNHNPACEPVWKSTDCIVCWAGIWNMIQEFRFSLYFLDLISIILIFGIFTPRPTEYIGYLGKIFPWLNWLVDIILIYPPGVFPNGQEWACYFINFFYLYEGFIALLIIYYIIDPLWEWLLRSYRSYQALIVVYRMRLMARRQAMEMFDEALLGSIESAYTIREQKLRRNNWRSYTNINSNISEDTSSDVRVRIDQPRRTESTADYTRQSRLAVTNQRELLDLTRYELDIERVRSQVASSMNLIAARLGARYVREDANSASRKRTANKVWQFVTSVLQMPHQATPAYTQHLQQYHRVQRQQIAPPGADAFPAPHDPPPSPPDPTQK